MVALGHAGIVSILAVPALHHMGEAHCKLDSLKEFSTTHLTLGFLSRELRSNSSFSRGDILSR
jgi:hypothetical protein